MSTYFHRTAAGEAILAGGFRDATGSFGFATLALTGVFISNQPLDINEGAHGDDLLTFELDIDLADYELVGEYRTYREWCVPAALLNEHARGLRLVSEEEEDELKLALWQARQRRRATPPE